MPKAKTIDRLALTLSHSEHLRKKFNSFSPVKNKTVKDFPPDFDIHNLGDECPMCHQHSLVHESGCVRCTACLWNACANSQQGREFSYSRKKVNILIPLNFAVGITVCLVGLSLASSIILNIWTQNLIEKCKTIMGFIFFLIERDRKREEEDTAEPAKIECSD